MVTCLAKTGSHSNHEVRMVSHVQLWCLRCGKGPSSHVNSPMTGQCPKIELTVLACVIVCLDKPFLNLQRQKLVSLKNWHPPLSFEIIEFNEIVAEPDQSLRSISHVWNISVEIFQFTSKWCYWILSTVLAVPFAILWAVVFAFSSFCNVWLTQPLMKTVGKFLLSIFQVYEKIVLCLFGPIGQAFGRCFQNVRLYTVKSQSQPSSGNV
ncbi:Caveolin-1 [Trichinella pseudospiralis]|uniref:Caveolin n=1 Tax=Trichinella pseudospiralis TaxID=6337 RepID=A0A0V1JKF8_TRIPS|nr:Caveolin-1 [Trichinella pseudospiralis]